MSSPFEASTVKAPGSKGGVTIPEEGRRGEVV